MTGKADKNVAKAAADMIAAERARISESQMEFYRHLIGALNASHRQKSNRIPSLHERLAQGVSFFLKPSSRCYIRGWERILGSDKIKENTTDGRDVEVT